MAQIPSPFATTPGGSAGGDLSGTYPNPTVATTHLSAALPVLQGGTGSTTQNFVDLTTTQNVGGAKTFTTSATVTGLATLNGGTTTAGSAPVLTPTFANGVAAQLTDTTRDYMVYLTVGTAGTALIIAVGPTSGVANTVVPSSTATSGEVITIRLPAGWFLKWSATTATLAGQLAIGC